VVRYAVRLARARGPESASVRDWVSWGAGRAPRSIVLASARRDRDGPAGRRGCAIGRARGAPPSHHPELHAEADGISSLDIIAKLLRGHAERRRQARVAGRS
jgi:hypothetical protein